MTVITAYACTVQLVNVEMSGGKVLGGNAGGMSGYRFGLTESIRRQGTEFHTVRYN